MKEIIDLQYQEENGILYPTLEMEENKIIVGKYGRMAMKFLKEEMPSRYDFLLATGELMKVIHQVDQQAMERLELLMDQMMKEKPLTDPTNTILSWQEREQIKAIAEEIILSEIVFKKR